jgi:hypothetical protein
MTDATTASPSRPPGWVKVRYILTAITAVVALAGTLIGDLAYPIAKLYLLLERTPSAKEPPNASAPSPAPQATPPAAAPPMSPAQASTPPPGKVAQSGKLRMNLSPVAEAESNSLYAANPALFVSLLAGLESGVIPLIFKINLFNEGSAPLTLNNAKFRVKRAASGEVMQAAILPDRSTVTLGPGQAMSQYVLVRENALIAVFNNYAIEYVDDRVMVSYR